MNIERRIIRNIKISGKTAQMMLPHLLTAGVVASGFAAAHFTPFYNKDKHITFGLEIEFESAQISKIDEKLEEKFPSGAW